jgi:hypothetical protein
MRAPGLERFLVASADIAPETLYEQAKSSEAA